jgi:Ca2+-binding RTX toxin-like protein
VRGGTDTVTVNDVTGTDLTTLNTNLAGSDGGDDTLIDEVIVPPGVVIGRDATAATVNGLGAQVRVVNGASNDRIHVTGVTGNDTVTIAGTDGVDAIAAFADGTDVAVFEATQSIHTRLTGIAHLNVELGDGDDTFSATGNVAPLVALDIDGGTGNDTLLGGNGADVLDGGPGADVVDGNQGLDTLLLGDGDDVANWDPGDGSDIVEGGAGTDRLTFNGSSANEALELSAVNGRVRLFRNIGTITVDTDDLEIIDLTVRGGTDTVTVNDVTGTDLTTLNTNLAGSDGITADGLADNVIVNGTAGDDSIEVLADGGDVVVAGLATTVRVAHADSTLDRLTVNGLDGNDTITSAPAVSGLILLTVVP